MLTSIIEINLDLKEGKMNTKIYNFEITQEIFKEISDFKKFNTLKNILNFLKEEGYEYLNYFEKEILDVPLTLNVNKDNEDKNLVYNEIKTYGGLNYQLAPFSNSIIIEK